MRLNNWFSAALLMGCALGIVQTGHAASVADYAQTPPIINQRETPLVMLGMSADNQLFYKAYSDFSDIDSDGALDTTYKDSFDYYGYFDSAWCYTYEENRFKPRKSAGGTYGHSCGDAAAPWSGNFLNWASMTRMDIIRKVLYGGKRSTDTDSLTVLERAYIPSDVHAFAKVYAGSDVGQLTPYSHAVTLCNVSSAHPYTSGSTPQLRLAKGSWRRWSINEGAQCQWDSGANRPDAASQLNKGSELIVRVEACVSGKDGDSSESCRSYNSAKKPAGLLQQYGEEGELRFGLITGSYDKYVSGGTLRKNIGLFGSNPDADDDEIDLETGIFRATDGIISSINNIRIIGWGGSKYTNNSNCDTPGIGISAFKDGTNKCRDWGNPIGEIYLEALRYFSAANAATEAFSGTDTSFISALKTAEWPGIDVHPMNTDNRCANCSIIMISSGVNSFDGDELSSASAVGGMTGASSVHDATNLVGTSEYETFTGAYLTGGGTDLLCSPKNLTQLSDALGICPESPGLEGTYSVAGLAQYGKVNDLRTDLPDQQSVDTYGVELSESIPSFEIAVGDKSVRFLPVCESNTSGSATVTSSGWLPCSLFDVEIIDQVWRDNVIGGELVGGTLAFHWEDSSWGNDYDLDGTQIINFCVGDSCSNDDNRANATYDDAEVASDEIRITSAVAYTGAGFALRFGYVVTGTDGSDGAPSGDQWLLRPGNQNGNYLSQLPSLPIPDTYSYYPKSRIFSAGSDSARLLEKPLWLAAKYGGFNDLNNDQTPLFYNESTPLAERRDDSREWDRVNNRTGAVGADGVPDNYFFASNPSLLLDQLQRVFESLVSRTSAGSNAAVVANSSTGAGAIYQALYQPKITQGGREVSWVGRLHGIFIDAGGYIREDSNGNAKLDSRDVDKLITLDYHPALDETRLQRYDENSEPEGSSVPISDLKPIWSAEDALAAISSPATQRDYGTASLTGRYIFTALDRNDDGEIDSQDTVAFTPEALTLKSLTYHRYLGLTDTAALLKPTLASELVNYIRGDEDANPAFRGRTIDIDGDGDMEPWRLGDIIHSSPVVVASPDKAYNVTNADSTYQAFVDKYRNRRQVVYVGANDGMLHAFNAGFWNPVDLSFSTQSVGGSETPHPLGQELWAYVPMNLLPHLQWLADPAYPHVYYMDGKPKVFDVNAFPVTETHPHGWGTILVIGMRFGGAPIEVPLDGTGEAATTFNSAYVVMDITDPEQPPRLLAEIVLPDLGLTVSEPALIKKRIADTLGSFAGIEDSNNQWQLVLGSGPVGESALSHAESDRPARMYALDLRQLIANAAAANEQTSYVIDLGGSNRSRILSSDNGWVGGAAVADWDGNLVDDNLYVGLVSGTQSAPAGMLMRQVINDTQGDYAGIAASGKLSTFIDPERPIQAVPGTTRDSSGDRWVLFGTGRQMVTDDVTLDQQQYFFGLKEPRDADGQYLNSTLTQSALVDTTNIGVFVNNNAVRDLSSGTVAELEIKGEDVETFSDLENEMKKHPGWYIALPDADTSPASRVLSEVSFNPGARNQFSFISYAPNGDSCVALGQSSLYELNVGTGTTTPYAPLGTSDKYTVLGEELSLSSIFVGNGLVFGTTYHQSSDGGTRVIVGDETGALGGVPLEPKAVKSGRQSWREIDMTVF